MIVRPIWIEKINSVWKKAPIAWIAGVRRVGKTTLSKMFKNALYLNCDLPSTIMRLRDPELFYSNVSEPIVIFDEIHRLEDPSNLLKIGADAFSHIRIIATGSSTLAATKKFKDTLTGRKRVVHLLPVLVSELPLFNVRNLKRRLARGGLPRVLLEGEHDPEFYSEWLDSFFSRDVQELYGVANRRGFLRLVEILLRQSGGLARVTKLASDSGISRPTVSAYLDILQTTLVITVLRPFYGGGRQEILRQQKIYGFDTGFVCHFKGWESLREEDCGILWEHLVLEMLLANTATEKLHYWRDKQKREIDFVIKQGRDSCATVECKWNAGAFSPKNLKAFRAIYAKGENYVVSPAISIPYKRSFDNLEVTFLNPRALVQTIR